MSALIRKNKQPQLVIAFHTTSEAMAMEKLCKTQGLPGRLIPVPRAITSDCGIAWTAPLSARAELRAALEEAQIEDAGFFEVEV